jgi:hypothetical protein
MGVKIRLVRDRPVVVPRGRNNNSRGRHPRYNVESKK